MKYFGVKIVLATNSDLLAFVETQRPPTAPAQTETLNLQFILKKIFQASRPKISSLRAYPTHSGQ